MRNRNGPKAEPCGTPERIIFQDEHWPSTTTLFFGYQGSFPRVSLSKALDMSRNIALTSVGGL